MSFQKNFGAVRRYAQAMKFAAWLQALPHKLTPPPFRLMQIGSAFWQSRALYVATQLDIATVLGDEELDAENIAARVEANSDAMGRLLRFLAAVGIFEETAPRTFRNNKLSIYLRADHPKNARAMILMHNSEAMSRPWFEQLERGVRDGVPPFRLAHGEELFAWTTTPISTCCFPRPWTASRRWPATASPPISTGDGSTGSSTWVVLAAPNHSQSLSTILI